MKNILNTRPDAHNSLLLIITDLFRFNTATSFLDLFINEKKPQAGIIIFANSFTK